jgi:hypothetical protein
MALPDAFGRARHGVGNTKYVIRYDFTTIEKLAIQPRPGSCGPFPESVVEKGGF